MQLKQLKIGQRLALAFGLVLVLLAVVLTTGVQKLSAMNDLLVKVVEVNNARIDAASAMRDNLRRISIAVRDMTIISDEAQMQEQSTAIAKAREAYAAGAKALDASITSEEGKTQLASTAAAAAKVVPLIAKGEALARQNDIDAGRNFLRDEFVPAMRAWTTSIDEIITLQSTRNSEDQARGRDAYAQARVLMFTVGAVALIAAVAIAWLITRSIVNPLNQAVAVARTVAAGDLSSHIEVTSLDETGQLLGALKDMNTNLRDIVSQVREGTDTIATASDEIASGNLDLSSRTETQASSLQETAASMEQLTHNVAQSADSVNAASDLARRAAATAGNGQRTVTEVVSTMEAISASSHKVLDIVGMIDGIAFQTNILALNAAVEAARAGEQGRGFAVVAGEVRTLAQRSAGAAKEIKALIDASILDVDNGNRLSVAAGAAIQEVVGAVDQVTRVMDEIAGATREQSGGIGQVNQAVTQLDAITQQNAALVEEAAAATATLARQTDEVSQALQVFQLQANAPGRSARAAAGKHAMKLAAA